MPGRLTDTLAKREMAKGLPEGVAQKRHNDDEPGFFAMQGRHKWTFSTKHIGKQHTIGHWPRMSTKAAQYKALAIKAGELDVEPEEQKGQTLTEAWAKYLTTLRHKNRSPRTIANYDDLINRVLKDWLETPLATLANNPEMAQKKHMALTKEGKRTTADHAMRALKAVYRHARRTDRSLPSFDPTSAVDFNGYEPDKTTVRDLSKWYERLQTIENGVRREFHLFMLLSGSRPNALRRARWEHLNVEGRALHFPDPVGPDSLRLSKIQRYFAKSRSIQTPALP